MSVFLEAMNKEHMRFKESLKQRIAKDKIVPMASMLFGNRFKSDQTLYEYMIEFLLIFSSAKDINDESSKFKFHDMSNYTEAELKYCVEPRMGLRRFIFFDKARKKGVIKADNDAYNRMIEIIRSKIDISSNENKEEYVESIQDLFHGYAVVIKNRFWGAQALLPICPEFIVCGCDPSESNRKKKC